MCNRCSINVLKMETHDRFEGMNWRRIATWNGETLQLCSKSERITNQILGQPQLVLRVPLVEYFPFVMKHEYYEHYGDLCPHGSNICYGLKRTPSNDTVIDYAERFCCSGLTIDVLAYLEDLISYQFELYFHEEQLYGVRDKINGTWNGILGDVMSGKGDVAADLFLNPERCTALDCSLGYLFTGFNAITKISEEKIQKKGSVTRAF